MAMATRIASNCWSGVHIENPPAAAVYQNPHGTSRCIWPQSCPQHHESHCPFGILWTVAFLLTYLPTVPTCSAPWSIPPQILQRRRQLHPHPAGRLPLLTGLAHPLKSHLLPQCEAFYGISRCLCV